MAAVEKGTGFLSRLSGLVWPLGRSPNVTVHLYLRQVRLGYLDSRGLLDAVQCVLSGRGASTVHLVIAPCEAPRRWPLSLQLLTRLAWVRQVEQRLSECSEDCADLHGRLYPDEYPSARVRCMRVSTESGCYVVYVEDAE